MLLEQLKPTERPTLCAEISTALAAVEHEVAQYDRALQGKLDESQRVALEQLRGRRARLATLLRARLDAVQHSRYHDDPTVMRSRTLQVA